MRIEIKDSWLEANINKPKRLYKEYQIFYKKIVHINKIFFNHRTCNIPMHEETIKLCSAKVDKYLKQMDLLSFVIINKRLPDSNDIIPRYKIIVGLYGYPSQHETSVYMYNYIYKSTFKERYLNDSKLK